MLLLHSHPEQSLPVASALVGFRIEALAPEGYSPGERHGLVEGGVPESGTRPESGKPHIEAKKNKAQICLQQ